MGGWKDLGFVRICPLSHREDFDLMAAASLTPKAGVWKRSEEIGASRILGLEEKEERPSALYITNAEQISFLREALLAFEGPL